MTTVLASSSSTTSTSGGMNSASSFRRDDWIVSSLPKDDKNDNDKSDDPNDPHDNDLSSSASTAKTTNTNTHLFVHFDINETILLGDDAGGDTRNESIQKMIAKSAFVQMTPTTTTTTATNSNNNAWEVTQEMEPTHWWDGQPIEPFNQEEDEVDERPLSSVPKLYTGWEWPNDSCPYYRTNYKKYAKDFVCSSKCHETNTPHDQSSTTTPPTHDHHPFHGHIYRPILQACEGALTRGADNDNNHILPAFYRTVEYLIQQDQQCQKQQIQEKEDVQDDQKEEPDEGQSSSSSSSTPTSPLSFTIVFRTFGSDLDEITTVVSEFAKGHHPDYPHVYCHELTQFTSQNVYQGRWKDISVVDDLVEDDDNDDGNDDDPNKTSNREPKRKRTTKAIYELWNRDETQLIASGDAAILKFLKKQRGAVGIRDDYHYWKNNHYNPTAGKPIWVPKYHNDDESSSSSYDHHILFDDNIHNLPHDGIACVRQQQDDGSYESVDGSIMHRVEMGYQGVHMIRVPTIEPVLNPNWYIHQIYKARSLLGTKLL